MTNSSLSTALIQADLAWENPEENRKILSRHCRDIAPETDLIILPEMFSTGFSMAPEKFAEPNLGDSFKWMREMAKGKDSAITGSIMTEDNGDYFNRLYFVWPDGDYKIYDKKHLFTFAGEHHHYSPGHKRLTVDYKGWKICPMVCYDLRFPVWLRNTDDYELLIVVANWPAKRSPAWDTLLKARAIENMAYVAGVNRVGTDGNDIEYNGHSAVYNMLGEQISKNEKPAGSVENIELRKEALDKARKDFSFLNDRDDFEIKN